MSKVYPAGWITVPGKGRRWRTAEGEYKMQRPAGGRPGVLGAIRSTWSEADRRLGGWLPGGGTASPLTRARQEGERRMAGQIELATQRQSAGYVEPSGRLAKYGPIVNAAGAAVEARANPLLVAMGSSEEVEKISNHYRSNPESTNKYDLNTNLFLRYLSGVGKDGLRLSPEHGRAILSSIEESRDKGNNKQNQQLKGELESLWPGSSKRLERGETPVYFGGFSDSPMPSPNTIPWDKDGRGELRNSLGSFWATPKKNGGYLIDQEEYDFSYASDEKGGNAGHRRLAGQQMGLSPREIGMRIVSAGHGKPFSYSLEIDKNGEVLVR
jgi:hypothetical protein